MNLLPLSEYSIKYNLSISTLRRKIKANEIKFQFEDGKYLLLDEPVGIHHRVSRPSLNHSEKTKMNIHPVPSKNGETKMEVDASSQSTSFLKQSTSYSTGSDSVKNSHYDSEFSSYTQEDDSSSKESNMVANDADGTSQHEELVLVAANRLLTELKRAYTQILQEKEAQILLLKEEIADLKTLIKVLEKENSKQNFYPYRNP